MKTGILLINLGTPRAPDIRAVRQYLAEFLSDPLVIDVPWLLRMIILYGLILPFRPRQSAKAYQAIWTDKGSPLLVNSQKFASQLQQHLGDSFHVSLGMRYGEPALEKAIAELKAAHCEKLVILPLFPQYSGAATQSALQKAQQLVADWNIKVRVINYFYHHPAYQQAIASVVTRYWQASDAEFLLFSYHGLPERQLAKSGCKLQQCDRIQNCLLQQPDLSHCYRAQCFATTAAIVKRMQLAQNQYQSSFQSRLGKAKWIQPYTDKILEDLYQRGIKKLMVVCPAFVADCLETLEEIGLRLKAQWLSLGGTSLELVPCLNAEPEWIDAAAVIVKERALKVRNDE